MQLVPRNHPVLTQPTPPFDFANPPTDPIQLAKDLAAFMYEKGGIGLAAPQVGLPYRCFVLGHDTVFPVFNPKIVHTSPEEVELEEGCLTFPGIILKIKRPQSIRARFTYANGEIVTKFFEGITARIFLHELDHIDGILFLKRISRINREMALKKLRKVEKGIR